MRNYTRHTVESLTAELTKAQKAGSSREVSDLGLLIRHLREPGIIPAGEVQAARNRQGARRVQRDARNPAYRARSTPRVGDTVRDQGGDEWVVERTERKRDGMIAWGHLKTGGSVNCPYAYLTVLGASESEPVSAPIQTTDPFRAPAEALYAALWDVLEGPDGPRCPPGIEEALRAYEAALAGVP